MTSVLALVIALGTGTAYAANTVGSTDIIDGEVKTADIGADAVDSSKVLDGSIGTADIADHSVGVRDLKGTDHHQAISVAPVAAGRCVTITEAAGGAKPGDAAVVTTDGAIPAGLMIYAQRATAGHVQIKVCNLSAAASPAIADLPVRLVTIR